jgi:photosystem II stability/assembly factor-like uncharacterized protein
MPARYRPFPSNIKAAEAKRSCTSHSIRDALFFLFKQFERKDSVPMGWKRFIPQLLLFFLLISAGTGQARFDNAGTQAPPLFNATFPSVPYADEIQTVVTSSALPGNLAALLGDSVRYSLDGGSSWRPVITTPWAAGSSLSLAIAPSPDHLMRIIASATAGNVSTFYRTDDFGAHWTELNSVIQDPNCTSVGAKLSASAVNPARIYIYIPCYDFQAGTSANQVSAVGYTFFTSADAGVTWSGIGDPITQYGKVYASPVLADVVYFVNTDVRVSVDAGKSWATINAPLTLQPFVLDGQDPNILYAWGSRSEDGGAHWISWSQVPACSIYGSVTNLQADLGTSKTLYYQCLEGTLRSIDGGDHWEKISPYIGKGLYADFGERGRLFWARDDGLWSSMDKGSNWRHHSDNYKEQAFLPWENIDTPEHHILYTEHIINALAQVSEKNIWGVGLRGFITHWDGAGWETIASPVSSNLVDVKFLTAERGWAVGDQTILSWDGSSWTEAAQVPVFLRALDVLSADNAWAVGDGGKIYHWDGVHWNDFASPSTYSINSIDMLSADDGWASGGLNDNTSINTGLILHWQDGEWVIFKSTDHVFSDLTMLSASDGWAVSIHDYSLPKSIVYRWDGTNWLEFDTPDPTSYPKGLTSFYFTAPDDGWLYGDGALLHWNGVQWTIQGSGEIPNIRQFFLTDSGYAWFLFTFGPFRYHDTLQLFLPSLSKSP